MRVQWSALLGLAVIVSAFGGGESPKLRGQASADSVAFVLTWGETLDYQGNPVARYVYALRDPDLAPQNVFMDSTTDTTASIVLPRTLGTVRRYAVVRAVDALGLVGAWVYSDTITITTSPTPTPPVMACVQLDTVP